MGKDGFRSGFNSPRPAQEAFRFLKDPKNWWTGLFGEMIEGKSDAIGDLFSFKAGDGMHESHQELIELVPEKIIAWRVTKSHLSFLQNPNEWEGTTIRLGIGRENGQARVSFTHEGLVPEIECFGSCAAAWEQYMENLRKRLD
jgi:hypothetical protein